MLKGLFRQLQQAPAGASVRRRYLTTTSDEQEADEKELQRLEQEQQQQQQEQEGKTSTSASSGTTSSSNGYTTRDTNNRDALIDLVDLDDFNVQIARLVTDEQDAPPPDILIYELTDMITDWMNDSYERHLQELGYATSRYAEFDTVILLERKNRMLQQQQQHYDSLSSVRFEEIDAIADFDDVEDEHLVPSYTVGHRRLVEGGNGGGATAGAADPLYTAEFKGAALFTRANATRQEKVPADVVQWIQGATLANKTGLLSMLQAAPPSTGLGSYVVDINTFSVASEEGTNGQDEGYPVATPEDDGNLEVIIIVAVAVAAVAFVFLVLAIVWAWRYDRRNREAYLVGSAGKPNTRSDQTGSHSTMDVEDSTPNAGNVNGRRQLSGAAMAAASSGAIQHPQMYPMHGSPGRRAPLSEIGDGTGGGIYPESVISEDISTSLSQYYRSGLAQQAAAGNSNSNSAFDRRRMDQLNDAASVSSMESYGYSLDGYAPSVIMTTASTMSQFAQGDLPYTPADYNSGGEDDGDGDNSSYQVSEPDEARLEEKF